LEPGNYNLKLDYIKKQKKYNMKTKSIQKKSKKLKAINKKAMKSILGGIKRMDPNTGEILY
jgi:hypothetical protein